jgi:hypothetical protein
MICRFTGHFSTLFSTTRSSFLIMNEGMTALEASHEPRMLVMHYPGSGVTI